MTHFNPDTDSSVYASHLQQPQPEQPQPEQVVVVQRPETAGEWFARQGLIVKVLVVVAILFATGLVLGVFDGEGVSTASPGTTPVAAPAPGPASAPARTQSYPATAEFCSRMEAGLNGLANGDMGATLRSADSWGAARIDQIHPSVLQSSVVIFGLYNEIVEGGYVSDQEAETAGYNLGRACRNNS